MYRVLKEDLNSLFISMLAEMTLYFVKLHFELKQFLMDTRDLAKLRIYLLQNSEQFGLRVL